MASRRIYFGSDQRAANLRCRYEPRCPSLAPIDGAGSIQDSGLTSFHCIPIKEQVDEDEEVELSE